MIFSLRFTFLLFLSSLLLCSCDKDDPSPAPDAPKACFTTSGELKSSMPVSFTSDCSVNAVSYLWDFGDSKTSTEANPAHTYSNGGKFSVRLTVKNANGAEHSVTQSLDIIEVKTMAHFGSISADETWKADVIHIVFSYVRINNAVLTIEPGAVVRFMEGAHLDVGTETGVTAATLIAKGTPDKPILFTADADTPVAGYWRNITFGAGDSGNSIIENCIIEYGGGNDVYGDALIKIFGSAITVQNNTLRKSLGYAAYVGSGSFKSFTNNIVSECQEGSLLMDPETVPSIGLNNTLVGHVMVENGYIKSATATWKKLNVPYHMLGGSLYVGSETGTTWTIEPGTTIKFPDRSDILIGGFTTSKATLIANGTLTEPITFTSIKSEPTINDRWGALHFGIGTNALTSLKYCVLEKGGLTGSTAEYSEIVIKDCSINIESTKVLNSLDYAILLNSEGSFGKFTNNTIDNPGEDGIYLYANWAHTIGTGNTFNATRGILVNTDIITQSSATWLKQPVPYVITGFGDSGLDIYNSTPEGAKLTLAAGVQILMGTHGNIVAGGYGKGALVANGTAAEPILISSPRNPKTNGDWAGIQFGPSTTSGILNFCTLEYGGYYESNGMVLVAGTNIPVITNCIIRNSGGHGIVLQNASPTMSGNTFSGNTLEDIY
jgi:parallel beta-helix repeat protein